MSAARLRRRVRVRRYAFIGRVPVLPGTRRRGTGIPPGLRAASPVHAKRPPSPGDDGIIALALCADLGQHALEGPPGTPFMDGLFLRSTALTAEWDSEAIAAA